MILGSAAAGGAIASMGGFAFAFYGSGLGAIGGIAASQRKVIIIHGTYAGLRVRPIVTMGADMSTNGLNSFLLITLGAGSFAISFNKGRVGAFRESMIFAVLAGIIGLTKAADDGVFSRDLSTILAVLCVYLLLPTLGVMVSRQLFEASHRSRQDYDPPSDRAQ